MLDPRQLFRLLHEEEVAAVLVGGVAMIVQGVTHFTNDIDLCYRRDEQNMECLERALAPVHPRLRVEGLSDEQARALPFRLTVRTLRNAEMLTLRVRTRITLSNLEASPSEALILTHKSAVSIGRDKVEE